MESLIVSFVTVAIAELGDRTQLIAFMLAVRYRRPWPILAGMLLATLAAHLLAGIVGRSFGALLTPGLVDGVVGLGLVAMGAWALRADTHDGAIAAKNRGAFIATLVTFFIAEMGDKTQIDRGTGGRLSEPVCGDRRIDGGAHARQSAGGVYRQGV